jgi:hypothetical protein
MDLKATMAKIEAAVEKRAEKLAEAAGEDLNRLEEEIVGLLDFGHKIQQHPAVTGVPDISVEEKFRQGMADVLIAREKAKAEPMTDVPAPAAATETPPPA